MTAKMRSVDASGMWPALLWPGPVPEQAAGGDGEHALDDLVARRVGVRPRVEPGLDPALGVADDLEGEDGSDARTGPPRAPGSRPGPVATHSMPMNRAKKRNDEPRSFSNRKISSDRPHAARIGRQVAGVEDQEAADAAGALGQQVGPLDHDRGEEDGQGELGQLAGLEVERADVDPEAGAVDVLADDRERGAAGAGRCRRRRRCSGSAPGPGPGGPRARVAMKAAIPSAVHTACSRASWLDRRAMNT